MARRAGRSGGKDRYSWHGFSMVTPLTPANADINVFKLYDPIDGDHQEEVVLQRTIIHFQCRNSDTSSFGRIGMGLYLADRDSTGAMTSTIDPAGISAFDIEANWQLWHKIVDLPINIVGQQQRVFEYEVNIKAKRKIQDPKMLVICVRGTTNDT